MKEKVKKVLSEILSKLGWEINFEVKQPPQEIKFDFATTVPLLISKKYNVTPQEAYDKIKDYCFKNFNNILFEDIKFAPPGFLNLKLSREIFFEELKQVILQSKDYPTYQPKNKKVLIEFVSANPTGPLHIGHGRCAVLGDVLGNILKKVGYNLTKEYYVNDRGKQINILTASVISEIPDGKIEIAENLKNWALVIVKESKYKGDYIRDIAQKVCIKFPKLEIGMLPRLQEFIVETIMAEIKASLKNFNVEFDSYFYESHLYEHRDTEMVKKLLEEKGLIEEKEKAVWFKSELFGDQKDRVIIKSDGETTYFFSDIAYHYNKSLRGYDWLINIWGADHHGYVERIKSACKNVFELLNKNIKLDIILYQLVSLVKQGQKIPMSTREGRFVTLDEVVKEVGTDVARFFLLTKAPNTHLEFDFDLAKEHSLKNPVYYIQYAHTRCCGILEEVNKILRLDDVVKNINFFINFMYNENYEEIEFELIKKICFYPDVLQLCIDTLSVHHLCNYLLNISKMFHKFYEDCRVINKNGIISHNRLLIVLSTKIVLSNGLSILGISAPEKM